MTKRELIKELRERWIEVGKIDLRQSLENEDSPFGCTSDGLLDFRGVTIADSLHRVSFSNVDLSFATMVAGQIAAQVSDSLFVDCTFESNIGKQFVRCSFDRSRLVNSVMLGSFEECTFVDANMTSIRASQVHFLRCKIETTNLRKASFFDCTFDGCHLRACKLGSGSFGGSSFSGCAIEDLDFARTAMERVTGIDLKPYSGSARCDAL